jgi:RimJ/RimL family protein N-acetyltransferase
MASSDDIPYSPFLLLTPRLVLVPTPTAISIEPYRKMYGDLHRLQIFCEMGFGSRFPLRTDWSDERWQAAIEKEVEVSWKFRGMGDMAVGLWNGTRDGKGRVLASEHQGVELRIVEGQEWEDLVHKRFWEEVEWVGYAGVRDATPRLPEREDGDPPLPSWLEMIELRYGVSPEHWGKGIAPEAARGIMAWAVAERGVRRFIAETEKLNARSGSILGKLGFVASGTDYWKDPLEMEWERRISPGGEQIEAATTSR